MSEKITKEKVLEYFLGGLDCSQVVFSYGAEKLGFDKTEALKIAAAFGGGLMRGETCGCVTGAMMAIGLKYGHYELNDTAGKTLMREKKAEFEEKFAAANDSLICKELLEYDISNPEELQMIMEEELLTTLCPRLACSACSILDEIL